MDAALLQALHVQRPGIHERLDREPLQPLRDHLPRPLAPQEPAAERLDELAQAEVAALAEVEHVVHQLRARDRRRLAHHTQQRRLHLAVRRDAVRHKPEVGL